MITAVIIFLLAFAVCADDGLPPVDIPAVQTVSVNIPDAAAATAETPEAPAVTAPQPSAPTVETDTPEVPAETISTAEREQGLALRRMRDRRVYRLFNKVTSQWLAIARRKFPELPVKMLEPCKIIAHVQLPVNDKVLLENLSFYKGKYGGVLLAFAADDSPEELERTAVLIREKGFRVFIAYNDTAFPDPEKLRKRIITLAPHSSGFFLGYMKSYAHNHLADKWYLQYMAWTAREANPEIAIIGECYRGEIQDLRNRMESNTLDGVSGTLLVNAGYRGFSPLWAKKLYSVKGSPIPLIIGFSPYYIRKGISDQTALGVKTQVEEQWISNGSTVTVTLHGDGAPENDNLAARRLVLTPEKAK